VEQTPGISRRRRPITLAPVEGEGHVPHRPGHHHRRARDRRGAAYAAEALAEFPQLCEAETEAFGRLLGTPVQRLATIAHGDGICTTHVTAPSLVQTRTTTTTTTSTNTTTTTESGGISV
jgi:hypothetical protein